jgi:hypothetical protein
VLPLGSSIVVSPVVGLGPRHSIPPPSHLTAELPAVLPYLPIAGSLIDTATYGDIGSSPNLTAIHCHGNLTVGGDSLRTILSLAGRIERPMSASLGGYFGNRWTVGDYGHLIEAARLGVKV